MVVVEPVDRMVAEAAHHIQIAEIAQADMGVVDYMEDREVAVGMPLSVDYKMVVAGCHTAGVAGMVAAVLSC